MEHLWLILPILLGGAMAQDSGVAATTSGADLPTPSNLPFAVDSMLECLIDPGCDMSMTSGAAPAATPHSVFSTTTKVNGDMITVRVEQAGPTGFFINMHDKHHTMNCSAAQTVPVSLTCDPLPAAPYHTHHVKLDDSYKATATAAVIAAVVLGSIVLLGIISCCCLFASRRGARNQKGRTSTDLPDGQSVTEITRTTQTTGAGTLGRAAEEGRSVAPFAAAGAAGAGSAAENAGQGAASGMGNGVGQGVAAGQGAGQAIGQGGEAVGTGAALGASQAGQGVSQGVGSGVTTADQTGSEVVDNGSVRGRRTLRGANQQVIA